VYYWLSQYLFAHLLIEVMLFWRSCCVLVDERAAHSRLAEFDIVQRYRSVESEARVGYVRVSHDVQSSSKCSRRPP